MKKLATAIAAIALIGTPALAADMAVKAPPPPPPAPIYNWTGFYLGGHAGYGWDNDSVNFSGLVPPVFDVGAIPRSLSVHPKGFIGGGQIGYNWQVSPIWLVGIEGDLSGADIHGSTSYFFPGLGQAAPVTTTVDKSLEWFATLRGRLGLVFDRLLVYGTGGAAFGRVKMNFLANAPLASSFETGSVSETKTGWSAGAGAEYALGGNWSVMFQWLYFDLGEVTASGPQVLSGRPQPFTLTARANTKGNVVWAGLNYQFH
jgi:outer membrane immunogenic protein